MIERIQSLVGIARRAGKVCSGEAQIEAMLKKGKGKLLLVAEDSPNTQKKYTKWAQDLRLPLIVTGTKQELGLAIGLSPRSAILIMDEGFAKAILKVRG